MSREEHEKQVAVKHRRLAALCRQVRNHVGGQSKKDRVQSWLLAYSRRYSMLAQHRDDLYLEDVLIPARPALRRTPDGLVWVADDWERVKVTGDEGEARLWEAYCEWRWAEFLQGGAKFEVPCTEDRKSKHYAGKPYTGALPAVMQSEYLAVCKGRGFSARR